MSNLKDELLEAINSLLNCNLITREIHDDLKEKIDKNDFWNWKEKENRFNRLKN